MDLSNFYGSGYCSFGYDDRVMGWVESVLPFAERAMSDDSLSHWWRCGGTWFAGVNALENDEHGACRGGVPFACRASEFIMRHGLTLESESESGGVIKWDKAQISVCCASYPLRGDEESREAHLFRLKRDAAHLDGLLKHGVDRRRFMSEYHRFILGIPLTYAGADAAPFVIYEGSHNIVQDWLKERFKNISPMDWRNCDLTDDYKTIRKQILERCPRVSLHGEVGTAFLVHRFAIHGTSVWGSGAESDRLGRVIAFFRPQLAFEDHGKLSDWLNLP